MFDPTPGYVPAAGPRLTNRYNYIKLSVHDPNGRQIDMKLKFEQLAALLDSGYRILRDEAAHLVSECERDIPIP